MHFLPRIPIFRLCFATCLQALCPWPFLSQPLAASSQLKQCVVDFGGSLPSLQCCPAICPTGPSVLLCNVVLWGHAFSPPCALWVAPLGGRDSQLHTSSFPGAECGAGWDRTGWDGTVLTWFGHFCCQGCGCSVFSLKASPPAMGSLSPEAMMPPPQWLIVGHAGPCPDLCRRVCCLPSPCCSSSKAALVLVRRRNPNLASMQPSRKG